MLSRLRFTLLLPLAALISCASSNPSANVGGIFYTPASGDYVFAIASGSSSYFSGNIAISGSSASGVFRYTNPGTVCVSGSQDIPFSGSFANNVLTLTSASFSNSVATVTVKLPLVSATTGPPIATGTMVIAGGTCALASTPLQATIYPSFAATWTITLTSPAAATESLTVTQGSANADGQFPVTGSLVSGITVTSLTGLVSGPYLNLANTGSTVTVSANAAFSPVTVTVTGATAGTGTMAQ